MTTSYTHGNAHTLLTWLLESQALLCVLSFFLFLPPVRWFSRSLFILPRFLVLFARSENNATTFFGRNPPIPLAFWNSNITILLSSDDNRHNRSFKQ
ncbi:hypothetical protein F5X99DRAFT_392361 [Biscogniauxia marginata]|nr:hypothetical protein F5X99DRAFT_392361 [Biscogniauxia marginata]